MYKELSNVACFSTRTVLHPMPRFLSVVWWIFLCFPCRSYGLIAPQPSLPPSPSPSPSPSSSPSPAAGPVDDYFVPTLTPLEVEAVFDVWKAVNDEYDWPSYYPDPCYGPTGITCNPINGTYYVTSLELGSTSDLSTNIICGGRAYIHPSIFNLVHLISLQFVSCFVNASAVIPSNISRLSNLRVLSFQKNPALIGKLPPQIGSIRGLQRLILIQNGLQGRLPPELGSLSNLFQLEVYNNNFAGTIPPSLGNLQSLVLLDFSKNSFQGPIPSELGRLRDLQMLDLSGNNLQGQIPESLSGLGGLLLLDLSANNLSGGIPETFSALSRLQDLVLSRNAMQVPLPDSIWSGLTNLAALDLSQAGFTGDIPASIGSLSGVRYMALDGNNFTGAIPPTFGDLSQLQKLNISSNHLTGALPFTLEFVLRLGNNLALTQNAGLCYPPTLGGTALVLGLDMCSGADLALLTPPPSPKPFLQLPVSATGQGERIRTTEATIVVLLSFIWVLFNL